MDNKTEIPNEIPEESADINSNIEGTFSIDSSPLNQISNYVSEDTTDLMKKEGDYVALFDHKKEELEIIQNDLNDLMVRLNNFITDSQDLDDLGSEEDPNYEASVLEQDDSTEKQDGPQEKELLKQDDFENISVEDIYICDGLKPPEINWIVLGPFIESVVEDLQKIRNLNQMTNSVLQRMRSITGPEDTTE